MRRLALVPISLLICDLISFALPWRWYRGTTLVLLTVLLLFAGRIAWVAKLGMAVSFNRQHVQDLETRVAALEALLDAPEALGLPGYVGEGAEDLLGQGA